MSSDVGPLLVGLAAAGFLLVLIGLTRAAWPLVARIGIWFGQRKGRSHGSRAASQKPATRPRPPSDAQAEASVPTTKADDGVAESTGDLHVSSAAIEKLDERKAQDPFAAPERHSVGRVREVEAETERIIDDARRQAQELLEEAQLEAKRIVVAAGQELARHENELEQERAALEKRTRLDSLSLFQDAERRAEELLDATERQCEGIAREAEAEAQRKAAEITEEARRQAQGLLARAELEAKEIVEAATRVRAGLVNELAQERSILEETRTKLSGYLADMLEEVEGAPPSEGPAEVVEEISQTPTGPRV